MTMQTLGTADVFDGMSAEGRTRRRVDVARLVPYYLRTYALPPGPVSVNHIRQHRYQAPTVDPARKQATQAVFGGNRRLAAG